MRRIRVGDTFKYIGECNEYGYNFFTEDKKYEVVADMEECEIIHNVPNTIAFIDDEGTLHFASKKFLEENFEEVCLFTKTSYWHLCKRVANRWSVKLSEEMEEMEYKKFVEECKHFEVDVEDVLKYTEDMGCLINK